MNEQVINNKEEDHPATGRWVSGLIGAGVGGFGAKTLATQSETKSSEIASEFIRNAKIKAMEGEDFSSLGNSLKTLTNKVELHTEAEEWFKKQSSHHTLAGEAEALKQKLTAYEEIHKPKEASLFSQQSTLATKTGYLFKDGAETFNHPLVEALLDEHLADSLHTPAKEYFDASAQLNKVNKRMNELSPNGVKEKLDKFIKEIAPINEQIQKKIEETYPKNHVAHNTLNNQQTVASEFNETSNKLLNNTFSQANGLEFLEAEINKTTHLKNIPSIQELYKEQYNIGCDLGYAEHRLLEAQARDARVKIHETQQVLSNLGVQKKLNELLASGASSYEGATVQTIKQAYLETPNMQTVKRSFENSVDYQKHRKINGAAISSLQEAEQLENAFIPKLKNALKYSKVTKIPGGIGTAAGAIALGAWAAALYSALSDKSHAERVLSENKNLQHNL